MTAVKKSKSATCPKSISLIGTQTGQCQICKVTKKLFILRYGFNLCEECLTVCTSILEQLDSAKNDQKSTEISGTKKIKQLQGPNEIRSVAKINKQKNGKS